jgi:hypothetical protein
VSAHTHADHDSVIETLRCRECYPDQMTEAQAARLTIGDRVHVGTCSTYHHPNYGPAWDGEEWVVAGPIHYDGDDYPGRFSIPIRWGDNCDARTGIAGPSPASIWGECDYITSDNLCMFHLARGCPHEFPRPRPIGGRRPVVDRVQS